MRLWITLSIATLHSWSMYSHGFAVQPRQVRDRAASVDWAVVHVHLYWLHYSPFVWPAKLKQNNENKQTNNVIEAFTACHVQFFKYAKYHFQEIGFSSNCNFDCCKNKITIIKHISIFICMLFACDSLSIWTMHTEPDQQKKIYALKSCCRAAKFHKRIIIFGLYPRNFVGASSFLRWKAQIQSHHFVGYSFSFRVRVRTWIHSAYFR